MKDTKKKKIKLIITHITFHMNHITFPITDKFQIKSKLEKDLKISK